MVAVVLCFIIDYNHICEGDIQLSIFQISSYQRKALSDVIDRQARE